MTETQQVDPNEIIGKEIKATEADTQPVETISPTQELVSDVRQTPEHQRMLAAQHLYDSLVANYGDAAIDSPLTKKIIRGYFGLGTDSLSHNPQAAAEAASRTSSALEAAKTDEKTRRRDAILKIADVMRKDGNDRLADNFLASVDLKN